MVIRPRITGRLAVVPDAARSSLIRLGRSLLLGSRLRVAAAGVAAVGTGAAALVACPRVAHAQSAEQRFDEGRAAMRSGDYAAACVAFRDSFEKSGSKGALYNLAQCEDEGHLGKLASSLSTWREVRARFGDKPEILAEADARIAALDRRVAKLTLRRAATLPAGATATLDGRAAALEVAIPLDAGHHVVEVGVSGGAARRIEVDVADGDAKEVVVDVGSGAAQGTTAPDPPRDDGDSSSPGSGLRTAAWIAGGAGLVGLGLFVVSLPIQADASSALDEACRDGARGDCGPGAADAASRGETWQIVEGVGLGVGVLGLGLGATFFVLGADDDDVALALRGNRVEVRGSF